MSVLTLADLLAADPASFAVAAATWEQLTRDLDDVAEELVHQTRALEYAWPHGSGSEAAYTAAATLRSEVSNAYPPARRIHQALSRHADGMRGYAGQAREIVAAARRAGYAVDGTTGLVTAASPGSFGGADVMVANQAAIAAQAERYADELATVLDQARPLDDSTASAISVELPQPERGFGRAKAPDIGREEIAGQQGRPAREVNDWWTGLTPEQQERAIQQYPDLIGWLDGVPATDRDAANRISLDRHQDELQRRETELANQLAQLRSDPGETDAERTAASREIWRLTEELQGIDRQQATLDKVDATLTRLGDRGLLLGIDPAGDGKAIVAVGNPDSATHTAVWVPGTSTELTDIRSNVQRVENLQRAADALTAAPGDVSTIMWLGYDAPELGVSMGTGGRAEQGAAALAPFVDGLRVTYEGGGSQHLTAIGHSYGSAVLGEAAQRGGGLAVDDFVTAGSPGVRVEHASDLGLPPGHVWAGSAVDDGVSEPVDTHGKYGSGIPLLGPHLVDAYDDTHGGSPHEQEFGANRFHVDTSGHSAYWQEGSASLQNQAGIVVGRYEIVGLDHGLPPHGWR
ncbi:alpha/beta hydrolase [Micromonospora sp. WMMD1102]|uniref:alpha/beta hydrolase n=1 Tax=Micromonospora sp. WMMD1102 TaxID=3016105 RepID=UPI002414F1A4|nr:alpha/beta hydrolase [Micromonospora sp. WMMD1102]MDG4791222.1 alpha/beta hydrolase [Micromonospora sp. WMMD1102]